METGFLCQMWSKTMATSIHFIHHPALESKGHDMCLHCRIELTVRLGLVGLYRDEVARQALFDVK